VIDRLMDYETTDRGCHDRLERIRPGRGDQVRKDLAPRLLVRTASCALSGEAALARTLQEEALPAVKAVFFAKNPIPLAMLFNSHLRLPMIAIPELLPQLKNLLRDYTVSDLGIDLDGY
jgi:hypothetical protein